MLCNLSMSEEDFRGVWMTIYTTLRTTTEWMKVFTTMVIASNLSIIIQGINESVELTHKAINRSVYQECKYYDSFYCNLIMKTVYRLEMVL